MVYPARDRNDVKNEIASRLNIILEEKCEKRQNDFSINYDKLPEKLLEKKVDETNIKKPIKPPSSFWIVRYISHMLIHTYHLHSPQWHQKHPPPPHSRLNSQSQS